MTHGLELNTSTPLLTLSITTTFTITTTTDYSSTIRWVCLCNRIETVHRKVKQGEVSPSAIYSSTYAPRGGPNCPPIKTNSNKLTRQINNNLNFTTKRISNMLRMCGINRPHQTLLSHQQRCRHQHFFRLRQTDGNYHFLFFLCHDHLQYHLTDCQYHDHRPFYDDCQ